MYSKAMFAKQFKELIDKRGLTQRAVAERINTTETTISRYVSGDRTPNIETAVELASVLGVTLDVLVGADLPAAGRTPPDVSILVACYEKASVFRLRSPSYLYYSVKREILQAFFRSTICKPAPPRPAGNQTGAEIAIAICKILRQYSA